MGNQCTGTRVKDMISCIDFKKSSLETPTADFKDEEDIHKKIDRFVEDYHKTKKRKTSAISAPKDAASVLNISKSSISRPEETKYEWYYYLTESIFVIFSVYLMFLSI